MGGDQPHANDGLLSSVSAPATVLLFAPAMSDGQAACPAVGSGHGDPSVLLLVSLNGSIESHLDTWRRYGNLPERVYIVSDEETRSVSPSVDSTSISQAVDGGIKTKTIPNPGDLSVIGHSVDQCLSAAATDSDEIRMCVDSLTTVLYHVDTKSTFQFLHALLPAITARNVVAHFHMDPSAHDEQTCAILQSLFDATFQYGEETDEWQQV